MSGRGVARRWGELESEILAALWAAERPMTASDVLAELADPDLAYKTVLTVLLRLHERGVLTRERVGRAHAYQPTVDRTEQALGTLSQALGRGDRTAVLRRFLDTLDVADERALRALLDQRGDTGAAGL